MRGYLTAIDFGFDTEDGPSIWIYINMVDNLDHITMLPLPDNRYEELVVLEVDSASDNIEEISYPLPYDILGCFKHCSDGYIVVREVPPEEYAHVIRYDDRGNEVFYKHPCGDTYSSQYNEENNLIRLDQNLGEYETWEYDDRQNVIRYFNSVGNYWKTCEYDSENRLISYKTSDGVDKKYHSH